MEINKTLQDLLKEFNKDEEEFISYIFQIVKDDYINTEDLTYKAMRKIDEIKGQ